MQRGALAPYERALRDAGPLGLHTQDGRFLELDVARWLADVDAVDATVLDRVRGPVLDIGCGPGRFVSALGRRGVAALGLDIADTAVALTRGQGFPALLRSVFHDIPGEGRWPTALLIDGNVGIGADPLRLLSRVATLLAPDGRLIVECDPDDDADDLLQVRFTEHGTPVGPSFGWARVGVRALRRYAAPCGYAEVESWSCGGRSFVLLDRVRSRSTRTA